MAANYGSKHLPTGRYIHHSSNQYLRYFDPAVGEGEDLSESVKMLVLYVANFGPFEPQRAPHWLLVRHMMSHWHWTLDAINDWLCTKPAEPTSICQTMLAKAALAGQDRAHDHALLQHPSQRQPPGDAARP